MVSAFVLELVSAGYFGGEIGPSFRAEGRAMLDAVLNDLRRIPELRVVTPQAAVGDRGLLLESVRQHACDAALIIAPEFDGLLERFCTAAATGGAPLLNCEPSCIRLCGDKWSLFQHLESQGIPTIPTRLSACSKPPSEFPCVVKPRDGAGSWLVSTITDESSWQAAAQRFAATGRTEYLCQPLIAGAACSMGAAFSLDGRVELLPIAEQRLSDDGEYRYLGGRLPARVSQESAVAVRELIERSLGTVSGLRGYVGCDAIVPWSQPSRPLLVEINPRLTTSYIGYRRLCRDNLMERLLAIDGSRPSLRWHDGAVAFDPQGRCECAA